MANVVRKHEVHPQDLSKVLKDVSATYGTDVDGNPTYALVLALEPNSIGGGGSNTQYAEGTTQATPTGTVILWRDGTNVLRTATPSNGLPVNVVAGGAGGGLAQLQVRNASGTFTNVGFDTGAGDLFVPADIRQLAGTAVDTNSGAKSAGTLRIVIATDQPALTNALKVDGSAVTQPVSGTVTANAGSGTFTVAGTVTAQIEGAAGNGASSERLASSAATVNSTNVKGSAGTVYGVHVANTNAALRYVHLYDKATAPTVGTDTPIMSIPVPPTNGGIVRTFPTGIKFTSGIGFGMTTDAAATNLAVAAGDLVALGIDYV